MIVKLFLYFLWTLEQMHKLIRSARNMYVNCSYVNVYMFPNRFALHLMKNTNN